MFNTRSDNYVLGCWRWKADLYSRKFLKVYGEVTVDVSTTQWWAWWIKEHSTETETWEAELHDKPCNGHPCTAFLFLWTYCLWGQQSTLTSIMQHWEVRMVAYKFVLQKKYQSYSSTMTGHTQVSAQLRPSQNLDEQCCHAHPTVLISYHHTCKCVVPSMTVCTDIII